MLLALYTPEIRIKVSQRTEISEYTYVNHLSEYLFALPIRVKFSVMLVARLHCFLPTSTAECYPLGRNVL